MVYLLASLTTRPGEHPKLMAAAKVMIAATRMEPGCLIYDLNVSITNPSEMVFVDAWESRAALSAHFETPHMKVWQAASEGYFVERKIEVIHPEKVEML